MTLAMEDQAAVRENAPCIIQLLAALQAFVMWGPGFMYHPFIWLAKFCCGMGEFLARTLQCVGSMFNIILFVAFICYKKEFLAWPSHVHFLVGWALSTGALNLGSNLLKVTYGDESLPVRNYRIAMLAFFGVHLEAPGNSNCWSYMLCGSFGGVVMAVSVMWFSHAQYQVLDCGSEANVTSVYNAHNCAVIDVRYNAFDACGLIAANVMTIYSCVKQIAIYLLKIDVHAYGILTSQMNPIAKDRRQFADPESGAESPCALLK